MKRCDKSKERTCKHQDMMTRCDCTHNTCRQCRHRNIGIQAIIIGSDCQNRRDHRKQIELDQKRDSRHIESKKEEDKETCDNQFLMRRSIVKRCLTNRTFPIGIILNILIQALAMNIHCTSTTSTGCQHFIRSVCIKTDPTLHSYLDKEQFVDYKRLAIDQTQQRQLQVQLRPILHSTRNSTRNMDPLWDAHDPY